MPRSKKTKRRIIQPDPKYKSRTIAHLINRVMKSGKKTVAQNQVYAALAKIKTQANQDPLEVLETAIKNTTPQMEVRSRRVGGAAYQVPMPVRGPRGFSLAIRWLVIEAGKRSNKDFHTYADKLATEITEASQAIGGAVQRKITSHKMAEANKAFAHFRW